MLKGNTCIYAISLTHTAFRFRILRCLLAHGEKYWETFSHLLKKCIFCALSYYSSHYDNFISFNCFNNLNWDLSPIDYCWFDYTKTWMFLYFKKKKIFAAVLHFISFQSLNNAIFFSNFVIRIFVILNLYLLLQLPPNCYDLFFVSFNFDLGFFLEGEGVFLFMEVIFLKYLHTIYTFIVQNHASCTFFFIYFMSHIVI